MNCYGVLQNTIMHVSGATSLRLLIKEKVYVCICAYELSCIGIREAF
jgi:hypothetical protein